MLARKENDEFFQRIPTNAFLSLTQYSTLKKKISINIFLHLHEQHLLRPPSSPNKKPGTPAAQGLSILSPLPIKSIYFSLPPPLAPWSQLLHFLQATVTASCPAPPFIFWLPSDPLSKQQPGKKKLSKMPRSVSLSC